MYYIWPVLNHDKLPVGSVDVDVDAETRPDAHVGPAVAPAVESLLLAVDDLAVSVIFLAVFVEPAASAVPF